MAISQISIRSWRNTQELRLPWFPPLTVSYFTRVIARNPQPTAQRLEMICGDELCSCSEGFTPAGWVTVGNQREVLPPDDINGAGKFCGSCWLTHSQPGVGAAHKEQVISAPFLHFCRAHISYQTLWDGRLGIYCPPRPKYHVAAKGCAFHKALAGQSEEDAVKEAFCAAVHIRALFLPLITQFACVPR